MHVTRLLKQYWKFAKNYPISGVTIFSGYGLAVVATSVVIPLAYKSIVDTVEHATTPSAVVPVLLTTFLLYATTNIVAQLLWRVGDFAITYFESKVLRDLSNYAFENLHRHSYGFFTNQFAGALIVRSRRFIDGFEKIMDYIAFEIWMHGLGLISAFVVLLWFSKILSAIYLAWLLLYVLITIFLVRNQTQKNIEAAAANSAVGGRLSDTIANVLTTKVFSAFPYELGTFKRLTEHEELTRRRSWFAQNYAYTAQGILMSVFEIASLGGAIYLWVHGSISAGTIVLTQLYLSDVGGTVRSIARSTTKVLQTFSDAQEMVDILELKPEIQDPRHPAICAIHNGAIDVRDITFSYGNKDPLFKHFSITVTAGEKIGLVGHSGAGKTTVTKLLLRFLDVQQGAITIDGQDIRHITQDDLRRNIGYVPQEPLLFHRTLRENITYAKPDATDAEIIDAATKAHAHEFIQSLPLGYDTLVGERGVKLSGGERQRVAIARVMLKNAPILILDEATSSLDSVSERHIQEALDRAMEGRTTLVIAHRLSTIRKMDRILVFEGGKIVEQGSHDELIVRNGIYSELWAQQSGGFIADQEELQA